MSKQASQCITKFFLHIFTSIKHKCKDKKLTRVGRQHSNNASTISVLWMTYITPVSIVRAGQGVIFVNSYFYPTFGVHFT